jgi:hypothetical protein
LYRGGRYLRRKDVSQRHCFVKGKFRKQRGRSLLVIFLAARLLAKCRL